MRLRRTFVVPKSISVTLTYRLFGRFCMLGRDPSGLRNHSVGPGKVVLAPQLLWWGARGPSVALTTPMNLSGSGHLKTKVP